MNNVLFIQFYYVLDGSLVLCNGFSDTHDLCKSKGDLIWVGQNTMSEFVFPFKKGTVYVSATFMQQIIQVIDWALEYPDIKFIAGGPIVGFPAMYQYEGIYGKIPNLTFSKQSVEEYFGVDNFSGKWKIDISQLDERHFCDELCFGFTVSNRFCYWGKCNFCSMPNTIKRTRKVWDHSCIQEIEFNGRKLARLNTNALTVADIKNVIPTLIYDENIFYDVYLRGQQNECDALDKVFQSFDVVPNLKFRIGVEFPSNRILKMANKGTTVTGLLNTINMLNKYDNIQIYLMFIKGWPELRQSDVDDLQFFVNNIGHVKRAFVFNLFCPIGSDFHERYIDSIKEKMYSGKFYKGYFPQLTDEVQEVNRKAEEIIKDLSDKVFTWNKNYLGKCKEVF